MPHGAQNGRSRSSTPLFVAISVAVLCAAPACDRPDESSSSTEEKSSAAGAEETTSGSGLVEDTEQPEEASSSGSDGATADRGEPSASPKAPTGDPPEPRRVSIGTSIEETIAAPASVESRELEFETDWYALEVRSGETVAIAVQPEEGGNLQPMVTVLNPETGGGGRWREIDARRSTEQGRPVQLTVTFEQAGTKIVTVDDARNLPRIGEREAPGNFRGGPGYAYTLTLARPGADTRDGSP